MHIWNAACQNCGKEQRKRRMRPLYTANGSSMPPHLLCYLCEGCYVSLLDQLELDDFKYVSKHTLKGETK